MRRAPVILLALVAATAAGAAKKSAPPAPETPPLEGVRIERLEGGARLEAVLPGSLRGYALPRRADGSRDVVLLVGAVWPSPARRQDAARPPGAPCDGPDPTDAAREAPCRLLRLDPSGKGAIEVLRDDLPADAWSLEAFDVDGDGTEELLLFLNGELRVFRDAGARRFGAGPERLAADPALGRGEREPRIVRAASASETLLAARPRKGSTRSAVFRTAGSASCRASPFRSRPGSSPARFVSRRRA